jgi:hypothetical protein
VNDDTTTRSLLQNGRLEQVCPVDCRQGWRRTAPGPEAAGHYCSACGAPTGPVDWRLTERTVAQRAASSRIAASGGKETRRGEEQAA